jgi:guanylate cyclase soluble subunit beta
LITTPSNKTSCSIVITAAEILGVTASEALEAFGDYFVKYVAKQGYSKLLHCLGSNFIEFLRNLNNLHLHLSMSFEAMVPPSFRCEQVEA